MMAANENDQIMADPEDTNDRVLKESREEVEEKSTKVVVDEDHPFDLEAYTSQYSGRAAICNLQHIITHCPQLASPALKLMARIYCESTRDTAGYVNTVHSYHNLDISQQDGTLAGDSAWVDEMELKNSKEKNKLEAELKTYTSNMIKESIRLAHRELGKFHHEVGNLAEALKHHAKCREFSTTAQQVIEMSIYVLEVLIEQRNYSHIGTYVYKAESALEMTTSGGSGGARRTTSAVDQAANEAFKERVQSKLDLATALANLSQGNYEKAARGFLKVKSIKSLENWAEIVSPSDIAILGVLCSLASLPRSAIKVAVVDSETFSMFIEQEPYIREILDAYISSKFRLVLDILERNSAKHALSPPLMGHLPALMSQIRSRALVLYFQPFQSVRLDTMSSAFGIDVKRLEDDVVRLIKEDRLDARVDGRNKILKSRDADQNTRMSVYQKVLQSGREMQLTNQKLLLRMSLIQSDLLVKGSRSERGGSRTMGGPDAIPEMVYD